MDEEPANVRYGVVVAVVDPSLGASLGAFVDDFVSAETSGVVSSVLMILRSPPMPHNRHDIK